MSSKEKNKTNRMIDTDRASALGEHKNYMSAVDTGLAGATNRASDMYNVQFGGFKDFAEGKYDYGSPSLGGGGGGGGGYGGGGTAADPRGAEATESYRKFIESGMVDRTEFDKHQANLLELGRTGGWSPERIASMDQNIGAYKQMGATGGIDAAGQARMRGGGVYDEFAQSGGLSQQDRSNIRARSTSTIPAFYKQMQDEQNRMGAIQGGYGPGRAAMGARLARDQAAAGAAAARDAELGITEQVNQGRRWGAEGMTSSEATLQGQLNANKLAGLKGAVDTESGMVNSIANMRANAATSGGGLESGMQGLIQKGKMFGTEGLAAQAEQEANRALQASAIGASNAQWAASFNAGNRLAGLEGMQSLYGMKPGEVDMYLGANRAGRDLAYGQQSTTYDARMANNPQRDWIGTGIQLAGAAGGLMTGLGNMGYGRPRPQAPR